MIKPGDFISAMQKCDIRFVTGVPDSLLKDFCAAVTSELAHECHLIAANEGAAVGLAIGHYLACGRPALVYMQNSGLGNIINPLTSLADPAVYGIPMILLIGWRSEMLEDGGQKKDEPQHIKQGRITLRQLEVLEIPYRVIDADTDIAACLATMTTQALAESKPVAIVVRSSAMSPFKLNDNRSDSQLPSRETAIANIIKCLPENFPVISTTGMPSRELFELRKKENSGHHRDFLSVGGMGHAISIASGIAITCPKKKVICLDGDGAMLMHLGALSNSAELPNLIHIVLNNGAHDSVGGQPTRALFLNLADIARSCGYHQVARVCLENEIGPALQKLLPSEGSAFLEICCKRGARADLGRPDRSPQQNKAAFMQFLAEKK